MPTAGVLTFVKGLDYVKHAMVLHLSCQRLGVPVVVCVDRAEKNTLDFLEVSSIDVIKYDANRLRNRTGKYSFESLAYELTPFDLTLKTDADVVFPPETDFDSIWEKIATQELLPGVPYTFDHNHIPWSPYRETEDAYGWAQVYSTMFGFKKDSELAKKFYDNVAHSLMSFPTLETDAAYSWSYSFVKQVSLNSRLNLLPHIPFHHCKARTLGWPETRDDWTNEVPVQISRSGSIYVAGHRVVLPMHYVDKSFPEASGVIEAYTNVLHSV